MGARPCACKTLCMYALLVCLAVKDAIGLCAVQLLFTVSVTPVIHNFWDIKDQNAQLVELIMFFKVRIPNYLPAPVCLGAGMKSFSH